MPLDLFYTMVQKSQKWPKTQIKGGPAFTVALIQPKEDSGPGWRWGKMNIPARASFKLECPSLKSSMRRWNLNLR